MHTCGRRNVRWNVKNFFSFNWDMWYKHACVETSGKRFAPTVAPTSVASNACDKKDAPADRRAPQSSEPWA